MIDNNKVTQHFENVDYSESYHALSEGHSSNTYNNLTCHNVASLNEDQGNLLHHCNDSERYQLGLFNSASNKEETPAFQSCNLQAEKSTELEIIATERGYRLHWQKQPIGIHLSHSEATFLAKNLQKKIDTALRDGKGIDFESEKWRKTHTSLLEKAIAQGGDES